MIFTECLIVYIDIVCVFVRFVCLFYLNPDDESIGACFCPLTMIFDAFHLHVVFAWQEWADGPGGHSYPASGFQKQLCVKCSVCVCVCVCVCCVCVLCCVCCVVCVCVK